MGGDATGPLLDTLEAVCGVWAGSGPSRRFRTADFRRDALPGRARRGRSRVSREETTG
jgi:hypothetical protein